MDISIKAIFSVGGPIAVIFAGAIAYMVGAGIPDKAVQDAGGVVIGVGIFIFIILAVLSWKLELNLFK